MGLYVLGGGITQTTEVGWLPTLGHTDLFQPGRIACVVIRASPLIWPTSFGTHHAPRPLCFLRRQQGAPPAVFRAGLWVWGCFHLEALWCPFWSPNRCFNCPCDLWVVKCPFSVKTDRLATQQSCALDHPDVAKTIETAVWWTRGITKARLDRIHPTNHCHPRRSVSAERGPPRACAAQDPGSAAP